MKKLAGTLFVKDGIKYDYSFVEAIKCLQEFCDHVFVVDAGSEDGTYEAILDIQNEQTTVIHCVNEWDAVHGREKLSHFTNIAIKAAHREGYEYQFNLQADEILHEKSYKWIRQAIETGEESFYVKRINLWQSPYMQLNVPQERKPCSTEIIRLAKVNYRSHDDAESLAALYANTEFLEMIRIYHTGFVRKREVMKDKIINMQEGVFEMLGHDAKLDECEIFNPKLWFSNDDLIPINEPLPKLIQQWAKERVYED